MSGMFQTTKYLLVLSVLWIEVSIAQKVSGEVPGWSRPQSGRSQDFRCTCYVCLLHPSLLEALGSIYQLSWLLTYWPEDLTIYGKFP